MSTLLRLRTAPTYWTRARVDRKNLRLYDVVAMKANVEALGHDCMSDLKTLHMTAVLGNKHRGGIGVQGRFGHPAMSENSAGRKVMLSREFRVQGDKLLHTVDLMESARKSPAFAQDPIEYILDMAEQQPQELAESVVIKTDLVWTFADGTEFNVRDVEGMRQAGHFDDQEPPYDRPTNALTELPVMRPKELYYLDLVNEGALTHDGMFSTDMAQAMFLGTANEYAQQLFELVDDWRDRYNIPLDALPGKVNGFVNTYVSLRGGEMASKTGNRTTGRTKSVRTQMDAQAPAEGDLLDDEETTEVEPVEDAADEVNLDEVEQTSQEAVEESAPVDDSAAEDESLATITVGAAEFAQLQSDVKQLKRIVSLQAQAIKNLTSEVDQPHVTQTVPRSTSKSLGSRGVQPPATLLQQRPDLSRDRIARGNVSHRPQDDEAMAVLRANQARGK